MADQADNLVLDILREIRVEQEAMRQEFRADISELNLKVGTLAQSMVSMRKDINGLEDAVRGMGNDMRVIALAVDEHTHRLDRIEAHYNPQAVQ